MVGESAFERYAKQIAVVMVVLLVLLPVYWMVNMSFKGRAEFVARPPTLVVAQPTRARISVQARNRSPAVMPELISPPLSFSLPPPRRPPSVHRENG